MSNLLLYDFLLARGGAEKLSLELCEYFGDMELLVSFINHHNFLEGSYPKDRTKILDCDFRNPVLQAILISRAFEHTKLDLDKFDNVIFSGSYAPLAVNRRSIKNNFLYCHTPPRFVYDLKHHYLAQLPFWQKPIFEMLVKYFRPRYENAIKQMDLIISNSENVKNRISKYLNRDAVVVYPPCDTDKYKWISQGDYYLSTARVEPYKRVSEIVKAFTEMPDKKLVVASGGSELNKLKEVAQSHSNIRFTEWVSDEELRQLMGNAIATIYVPMEEDFGISPVESMSAGKPVIGVDEGGIKETVVHQETGILLPSEFTHLDICNAVEDLTPLAALRMKDACEERAEVFCRTEFLRKMRNILG